MPVPSHNLDFLWLHAIVLLCFKLENFKIWWVRSHINNLFCRIFGVVLKYIHISKFGGYDLTMIIYFVEFLELCHKVHTQRYNSPADKTWSDHNRNRTLQGIYSITVSFIKHLFLCHSKD